jgi:3-hydroxybutyryl-CoA dehydratase
VSGPRETGFEPRSWTITQRVVDRYAELSGDYNPLHVDPDFAAGTPFGATIAHGGVPLQCLYTALAGWLGRPGLAGVSLEAAFLAPTMTGSTVTCRVVASEQEDDGGRLELECVGGDGTRTVAATATVRPLPEAEPG